MEKTRKKGFDRKLSLNKLTVSALNGSMDEIRGGAWKTRYCSNSCFETLCYVCYRDSLPTACDADGSNMDGCWTQTVCNGWNCPTMQLC